MIRPWTSFLTALAIVSSIPNAFPALGDGPDSDDSRQVTVMAIQARKGPGATDPKLEHVEENLNRVLPNHHFVLIEGKTQRLEKGQHVELRAGTRRRLTVVLDQSADDEDKVHVSVKLEIEGKPPFESRVKTPPNQLFFLDRTLNEDEHLLVAVGAR